MSTTKDYLSFILEQLSLIDNLTCKPMMGEYMLYSNNVLFGYVCDNRLLLKIVESNKCYNMETQLPYDGAKPMFFVEEMDDKSFLKQVVLDTIKGLVEK